MSATSKMMSTETSNGTATAKTARPIWKVVVPATIAVVALALVGVWAQYELEVGRFIESTDDAYVKADSTIVAPKVSGYVSQVMVEDNQHVDAGQILARIDERDFRANLDQASAKVAAASAEVDHLGAQLSAQQAIIAQAQAAVASAQAALDLAKLDGGRYVEMARVGYGSEQQAQQATTHLRENGAELNRQQAILLAAQRQTGVLKTQQELAEAELQQARAAEHIARLDLEYTSIVAPIAGTAGARSLRVGQFVQAGTQLMALVPLQQVYVVANFKETQLGQMHKGEAVALHIDTFSHDELRGHVDSVAPVSGQEFSLLPPDNATGNFTKIVQRIPVKIVLDPSQPRLGQLRPGMSVEAEVDTRAGTPVHRPEGWPLAQL